MCRITEGFHAALRIPQNLTDVELWPKLLNLSTSNKKKEASLEDLVADVHCLSNAPCPVGACTEACRGDFNVIGGVIDHGSEGAFVLDGRKTVTLDDGSSGVQTFSGGTFKGVSALGSGSLMPCALALSHWGAPCCWTAYSTQS